MYWTTFRIPYGISHYTRNKDCGTQRALRTLPVGGLQQEHVFLSARHLLSKYTTFCKVFRKSRKTCPSVYDTIGLSETRSASKTAF